MAVADTDLEMAQEEVPPAASKKIDFLVTGMTCSACAARLEKALSKRPGIHEANVNFALERANVSFDPKEISVIGIAEAVQKTGFDIPKQSFSFGVDGMTCTACSTRLEKALHRVPGVLDANVNFALERAEVKGVGKEFTLDRLSQIVEKAGFNARISSETNDQSKVDDEFKAKEKSDLDRQKHILIISALLTTPLIVQMIAQFSGFDFHLMPAMELTLAYPVQVFIGARFYKAAYKALRAKSGNMDVLVAMGTTAAFAYSLYLMATLGEDAEGKLYFEAAAVIITLVLFGKYLEAHAKRGTTAAIRQLMNLRPETACVVRDGQEIELPVSDVTQADMVVIRPGERIPVDGRVVDGQSELDEALITGESLPVLKAKGDHVTGGAINGTGLLKVEATAVGEDSTLSKIIRLVENAQSGKAPVQRLVDRIAEIFVPIVVSIAVVTFVITMMVAGNFEHALIAAVSVLVIACPCALGLATPTAIVTGTGAAARSGILIKDVEALECAHRLDAIIFDKTGTLTEGKPKIVGLQALDGDQAQLLQIAASVQQGSEHPLARAVTERAAEESLVLDPIMDFQSITGRGVTARVHDRDISIGSPTFMSEQGVDVSAGATAADQWENEAKTVIWIAEGQRALGLMAIADPIRAEAIEAIQDLSRMHVKTLMLSGDAPAVAQAVGSEIGLDTAKGGVRPEDKAQEVQDLVESGYAVGMIGDGINDAPALAAADVGIAMGTGTDIAMETAGITLMRPDPRLVSAAISASRATWRKIQQNLFWAFIYNVVGIPLAAMGMLTPTIAGAAMAFSSVSVVTNSLLLRRWKPKFSQARAVKLA